MVIIKKIIVEKKFRDELFEHVLEYPSIAR